MTKKYPWTERRSILSKKHREQTSDEIIKLRMIYSTLQHCEHFPKKSLTLLQKAAKVIEEDLFNQGVPKIRLAEMKLEAKN
jgi:hypothetical protein